MEIQIYYVNSCLLNGYIVSLFSGKCLFNRFFYLYFCVVNI